MLQGGSTMLIFLLCISGGTALNIPCKPYPSPDYKDVGMECSGMSVTKLPIMLPSSLELLILDGTNIPSLDNTSFLGRDLPRLKALSVTGGTLKSVGDHAFRSLPALTKLDLSHNHLDHLGSLSFKCNKQLTTVNLSHNPKLHNLSLLESSSIETMNIENGSLTTSDIGTLKGMTALNTLYLNGNHDLQCQAAKKRMEFGVSDVLVFCDDDTKEYHHPHPPIGGQESSTLHSSYKTELTSQKDLINAGVLPKHTDRTELLVLVIIFQYCIRRIYKKSSGYGSSN